MYTLLSAGDARESLGLDRRLRAFDSWPWESYLKDSAVLVHRGDLHLTHDLVLDPADWFSPLLHPLGLNRAILAPGLAQRPVSGLVVQGALHIDGALINADLGSGAFLLVEGDLTARAVSGGGAEIVIQGPAQVRDSVIGHYNDGSLHFHGGLWTRVLVNDDHDLSTGGAGQQGFVWSSHEDHGNELRAEHGNACSDDDDAGDVLPLALARRVRPELDRWGRLNAALIDGQPALLDGDTLRDEAPDLHRIGEQWDRLRLVPEAERSPALCDAALAGSGLALLFVPRALWTPERVAAAVARAPGLLHGVVPPQQVTTEMALGVAAQAGFASLPAALQTDAVLVAHLQATRHEPGLDTLAGIPARFITAPVLAQVRDMHAGHPRYAALEADRSRVTGRDPFYLLNEVWQAFLSEADIVRSLKESGRASEIHPLHMSPAVCLAMVTYRGSNLALLPPEKITDDLVDLALSYRGEYLAHVPAAMRTEARCRRAVLDDEPASLDDVPEPWREHLAQEQREHQARRAAAEAANPPPAYSYSSTSFSASRLVGTALWRALWSSSDTAVAAGARGWLQSRPLLVMVLGAALGLLLLAVHLALTVWAYTQQGLLAASLTLLLPYAAELYWAWQLWPGHPLLALGLPLLVAAQIGVVVTRRRLGRRLARA